jgi:hypothetical protein
MNLIDSKLSAAAILIWVAVGYPQITPFNSWRALVVYTNSIDSLYGGTGSNMYSDYFAGLIEGINQVYEDSEISTRGQLAGVIWDKEYSQTHPTLGYPGCGSKDDILMGRNGMARYVSLLDRYAADVLILVHDIDPNAGGCAFVYGDAKGAGYAGFWMKTPDNLYVFAHEMGHNFTGHEGNEGHCYGHRATLNNSGIPIDPVPEVGTGGVPVIPDTVTVVSAFHTTMAYGGGYSCVEERNKFSQSPSLLRYRLQGKISDDVWAGVYSNPALSWEDSLTSTVHPLGYNTFRSLLPYITYANDTVDIDTLWMPRNMAAIHQTRTDTVINFKGIPGSLGVDASMSVGESVADSQWNYAHLVATEAVRIHTGFRVTRGGYLRVSVGESLNGTLAKRNSEAAKDEIIETKKEKFDDDFSFKYQVNSKMLSFSISELTGSVISVSLFDARGAVKKKTLYTNSNSGYFERSIPVNDLPGGMYILRVTVDDKAYQRRFLKW